MLPCGGIFFGQLLRNMRVKKQKRAVTRGQRRWIVYLVRCADGSLYCGVTTNIARRLGAHNDGTGAKYTRGRGPVILVWRRAQPSQAAALRLEAQLKRLSRNDKELLVQGKKRVYRSAR
jgi:putative endonuclease